MKATIKLAVHLDDQLYFLVYMYSENFSIPSLIIFFILITFLFNGESVLQGETIC